MPYWLDIIAKLTPAIITLVLGLFGVWIAYQQYQLRRDKLRLDLFDKRLEAYGKLQDFFIELMRTARFTDDIVPLLSEARHKSRFLFGEDIRKQMDEIWDKAFEMRGLHEKLDGENSLPCGDERSKVCEEAAEVLSWLCDQRETSPKRFEKYLRFV